MGAKGVASDRTFEGPSWRDVYRTWRETEHAHQRDMDLRLSLTRSVTGEFGLRGALYCPVAGLVLATVGYGPAYPASAKTFPACLYLAVLEAEGPLAQLEAFGPSTALLSATAFFRRG